MTNDDITRIDVVEFIKENKELFSNNFHIVKIGIFGSFARNEQTPHSDIDLIIELEDNTQNIYEIKTELRHFFKNHFNKDVDIAREKYLKPRLKNAILKDVLYV